jgi:hypothetical protein
LSIIHFLNLIQLRKSRKFDNKLCAARFV